MTKKIEPFAQGMEASREEKDVACNPYEGSTAAHQEWLTGWNEGEADWSRLCGEEVSAGRADPDA